MPLELLNAWLPLLLVIALWLGAGVYGARRAARIKTPSLAEIEERADHITLVRLPDLTGIVRSYEVRIDGKNVGTIAAGAVEHFPIAPGVHSVLLKIDWCSSSVCEVEAKSGQNTLLYCGATYNDWRCTLAPFLWAKRYLYVRPATSSDA
jgi:hypothetical protein